MGYEALFDAGDLFAWTLVLGCEKWKVFTQNCWAIWKGIVVIDGYRPQ